MPHRLVIAEDAYLLLEERDGQWTQLARLPGGARALIPGRRTDEAALERAIEVAEDWLMPLARRLSGDVLEIDDTTHRLRPGLEALLGVALGPWEVDALERLFQRVVEMSTARQVAPAVREHPAFVADMVMVRELAHHGRVRQVRASD